MLGHFTFNNIQIPFYFNKSKYKSKSYLVDEIYIDSIKKSEGVVCDLIEDINSDNSDSIHHNSYIQCIYLTTNFPDKIEIKFKTNLDIQEIRDIKLNSIIKCID